MTKKDLIWRLKDLPDAVDVAELVDKKVITPEEARELLFNDGKNNSSDSTQVKALEEQVEFLQSTIEKLIDKLNNTGSYWHFTTTYTPRYPTTYWLGTSGNTSFGSLSVGDSKVTLTANSVIDQ